MAQKEHIIDVIQTAHVDLDADGKMATLALVLKDGRNQGYAMSREILVALRSQIDFELKRPPSPTARR